jgi:hypothetical protein
MAIIFSIINISISDKCTYICLHQYLCIFMYGEMEGMEMGYRIAIQLVHIQILIIGAFSCACFLLTIILRHFDGKCLNLLNMAKVFSWCLFHMCSEACVWDDEAISITESCAFFGGRNLLDKVTTAQTQSENRGRQMKHGFCKGT